MKLGLIDALVIKIKEAGWTDEEIATFKLEDLAESVRDEMIHYEGEEWDIALFTSDVEEDEADAIELLNKVGCDCDTREDWEENLEDGDDYINIEIGRCGFDVKTGEFIGS